MSTDRPNPFWLRWASRPSRAVLASGALALLVVSASLDLNGIAGARDPAPGGSAPGYGRDSTGPLAQQDTADGIACTKRTQHRLVVHREIRAMLVKGDHGTR